jgi:hypothetical protein
MQHRRFTHSPMHPARSSKITRRRSRFMWRTITTAASMKHRAHASRASKRTGDEWPTGDIGDLRSGIRRLDHGGQDACECQTRPAPRSGAAVWFREPAGGPGAGDPAFACRGRSFRATRLCEQRFRRDREDTGRARLARHCHGRGIGGLNGTPLPVARRARRKRRSMLRARCSPRRWPIARTNPCPGPVPKARRAWAGASRLRGSRWRRAKRGLAGKRPHPTPKGRRDPEAVDRRGLRLQFELPRRRAPTVSISIDPVLLKPAKKSLQQFARGARRHNASTQKPSRRSRAMVCRRGRITRKAPRETSLSRKSKFMERFPLDRCFALGCGSKYGAAAILFIRYSGAAGQKGILEGE